MYKTLNVDLYLILYYLYYVIENVRCGAGWSPDLHTPIDGDNKNYEKVKKNCVIGYYFNRKAYDISKPV